MEDLKSLNKDKSLKLLDIIILIVILVVFLILCINFYYFTLDDAYITFRYSQHLAQGFGIRWNINQDPVEGYSSTLWMLLSALSIIIGIDPVHFTKVLSILIGLSIIMIIFFYTSYNTEKRIIPFLAISGIGFNPAFALLTIQGLETTVASFFCLLSGILALSLLKEIKTKKIMQFSLISLLAFITRPDLGLFIGIVIVIIAINHFLFHKDLRSTLKFIKLLLIFLGIPVIAYIAGRYLYFGYIFPNSFYVKDSDTLISQSGLSMSIHYVFLYIFPFLILILYSLSNRNIDLKHDKSLLILISIFTFITVFIFINPIQAFLGRYQIPSLPLFFIIFGLITNEIKIDFQDLKVSNLLKEIKELKISKSIFTLAFCFILVIFPLRTIDDAVYEHQIRLQYDRVIVGQELASLQEENYTMFISESGALPYYSDWISYDFIGLNDEKIAHSGLTESYLEELNPELIMLLINPEANYRNKYDVVFDYIENFNYTITACIEKSGISGHYHSYFTQNGTLSSTKIADVLLNIPNLAYLDVNDYHPEYVL